jgi:hypothetical protein
MSADLPDRIKSKIRVDSESGCWVWTGYLSRGYGRVHIGPDRNGSQLVHRVVYSMLVGEIPAGADMDHLCRRTSCCNPDHLEPVPHRENVLRGVEAMRLCRNKLHPWIPENLLVQKSGYRTCRPCRETSYERRKQRDLTLRQVAS